MAGLAFVFSGQGAQKPGMGRELYQQSPAAHLVMDSLENVHPGLLELCFEGPQEALTRTLNAQPALLAVELAFLAAVREQGISPDACAGFSLGEWSAAVAAGVMTAEQAFRLVLQRARWMEDCCLQNPGGMSAVLCLDARQVEEACKAHSGVWAANYNSPGQTVVSGLEETLPAFEQALIPLGGRAMRLKVGGPFHCPAMTPAALLLAEALAVETLQEPAIPLYSNVTGLPYPPGQAAQLLARQVESPVRWVDTIQHLRNQGIDRFVEIGPGGVLCGLIAKTLPDVRCARVEDAVTLREAVALARMAETLEGEN